MCNLTFEQFCVFPWVTGGYPPGRERGRDWSLHAKIFFSAKKVVVKRTSTKLNTEIQNLGVFFDCIL